MNEHGEVTIPRWAGALAGVLATGAGLLVGSGVAALWNAPPPITTVGNRAIDMAPPFLKDFAVDAFGTNDKPVLVGGIVVTVLLISALIGVIGRTRPRVALFAIGLVGAVAVLAAAFDRTTSVPLIGAIVPSLLTIVVAVGSLAVLLGVIRLGRQIGDHLPPGFDRRAFLKSAFGVGVLAVIGGSVSRLFGQPEATASRDAVTLPSPARPAAAVPAGAQAPVDGVSSYITSNRDFYRIDTALQVPDVPADTWRLRIHGLVDREVTFTYQDILEMPLEARRITLTCVSNEVGGPYIGNAEWLGVPVHTLLERAGVQADADAVKSTSADDMTIGTPVSALTDPERGALLAIGMNGEPLPLEHGFPARLVVPGLYGYVSATKWLVDLEVTRFADFEAYWTPRGYAAEAPIKMSSRIDVPRSFEEMPQDNVSIGGVAWAQSIGISRVEVRIDDGDWVDVDLADEDSIDSWRQWSWTWTDATPGTHSVQVRATDADGNVQTGDRAAIRPDGTTGWHGVQFRVA